MNGFSIKSKILVGFFYSFALVLGKFCFFKTWYKLYRFLFITDTDPTLTNILSLCKSVKIYKCVLYTYSFWIIKYEMIITKIEKRFHSSIFRVDNRYSPYTTILRIHFVPYHHHGRGYKRSKGVPTRIGKSRDPVPSVYELGILQTTILNILILKQWDNAGWIDKFTRNRPHLENCLIRIFIHWSRPPKKGQNSDLIGQSSTASLFKFKKSWNLYKW